MAHKSAYFSVRKPDDSLPKSDGGRNGASRARVYDNIAFAALGLTAVVCLPVLRFLCFMLKTKFMEDVSTYSESRCDESWSRMEESNDSQEAKHSNPKLTGGGRSMPCLPTTLSDCYLYDDTSSVSNLSVGRTGFQELPELVTYTRRYRNRMNYELSYAIASAKSKKDLSKRNETPAIDGIATSEEEDIDHHDSPYEVVLDIKTSL